MSNPKPATGADWTQLLTDPDLISYLGELLQTYREAAPEKRDQALLAAIRKIKTGDNASNKGAEERAEHATASSDTAKQDPQPAPPAATSPSASPLFEPDIFTPAPTWEDRRRYPRLKCFVAVRVRVGGSVDPICGTLATTRLR